MASLEVLRTREEEVGREWQWRHDALNSIARVLGALAAWPGQPVDAGFPGHALTSRGATPAGPITTVRCGGARRMGGGNLLLVRAGDREKHEAGAPELLSPEEPACEPVKTVNRRPAADVEPAIVGQEHRDMVAQKGELDAPDAAAADTIHGDNGATNKSSGVSFMAGSGIAGTGCMPAGRLWHRLVSDFC